MYMKGSYVVILEVLQKVDIRVGSLGKIAFNKGYYAYIGSALNNLEKRIERHIRKHKKIHWHLDYVLQNRNVKIITVFYKKSVKKKECIIAKSVAQYGKAIQKFGCSDCKCESHLFKIMKYDFLKEFKIY